MKCEGEKTYGQPGDCPVCNMHLVAVNGGESNEPDHHKHEHTHSNEASHHHEHGHKAHSHGADKYYCPMRCEGDKIYSEAGADS